MKERIFPVLDWLGAVLHIGKESKMICISRNFAIEQKQVKKHKLDTPSCKLYYASHKNDRSISLDDAGTESRRKGR